MKSHRHPLLIGLAAVTVAGCGQTREQFLRTQEPSAGHLVAVVASVSHPAVASPSDVPAGPSDTTATAMIGDLAIRARWIGPARPLITGYDLLNRVSRFVVPYTRSTWLVELIVTNTGTTQTRMRAQDWQLVLDPGNVRRKPLALPFFKERWPTEAVRSESMMLDQAMAIGHVIRTLWGDREIDPGATETGILPYLSGSDTPAAATLVWLAAPQPTSFQFGVRP